MESPDIYIYTGTLITVSCTLGSNLKSTRKLHETHVTLHCKVWSWISSSRLVVNDDSFEFIYFNISIYLATVYAKAINIRNHSIENNVAKYVTSVL